MADDNKREPMVFFVAGMVFGGLLGYMTAQIGGSNAARPVPLESISAAAPERAAPAGHGSSAPDPNEVRALESLAGRDKTNAQARVELGNLYMDHARYQDAARWYREALALRPGIPDILVDLGACLVNMGKPAEGLASFEEALKREPGHKKALYNKGVALIELGKPMEAVAIWEDLVKRSPEDPLLAGLKEQIGRVRATQKAS